MKKIISVLLAAVLVVLSVSGAGAVSKIKSGKGDFYLQLNKTLTDNYGYKFKYKIYAFNVNSKSAKACNKKLYNSYIKLYKSDYDNYIKYSSMVYNIKGNTYKNGNILSIKQKMTGPSVWSYKSFNINKKTGKKITLKTLCKKYGYTKKGFYKALKNKQLKKIKAMIKKSPGLSSYADDMISYAKSAESRKGVQVYIDGSGKLCATAKLNIYAGAGIYQYIFKFSKK